MICRGGLACHPYRIVATNGRFVGAPGEPPLQIRFVGVAHYLYGWLDIEPLSTKYRQQSNEGYAHNGRLFCRGARDQELDGNKDTRCKFYIGSDRQDDIKPYILCSVSFYCWNMRS